MGIVDLTAEYTGVQKAWRGFQIFNQRQQVLVQDEILATNPATVWWFMQLGSSLSANVSSNTATLAYGANRLWLKILSGGGTFAVSNCVPLPTSPQYNASTYAGSQKLVIHLTNVTNTTLAVWMVPLPAGDTPPTVVPALTPLANWTLATPPLAINTTGSSLVVSWPNSGDYTLLQTTNLASGIWVTNGSTISTVNGTNSITITAPRSGDLFLRLKQ